MPAVGLGTCCRPASNGPPLIASALAFLRSGGRLIDTAQMYGNEAALGEAIVESGLDRSELWITSKVNHLLIHSRAAAIASISQSVHVLRTSYVDLMLIHGSWRLSSAQLCGVWSGLIDAQLAGQVRNIGVSNLLRNQIELLEQQTSVLPAVNEIEFHPVQRLVLGSA